MCNAEHKNLYFLMEKEQRDAEIDELSENEAKKLLKISMDSIAATKTFFESYSKLKSSDGAPVYRYIDAFAKTAMQTNYQSGVKLLQPITFICPACGKEAVTMRWALGHGFAVCSNCGLSFSA